MTTDHDHLTALINEHLWDQVLSYFKEHPNAASEIHPIYGGTKLHWLCSFGSCPTDLIEHVASLYPEAIILPDSRYGDTPLHILCRNSQTSDRRLRVLLRLCPNLTDGVLIRNRFGGTPLHSASNHNAIIGVLHSLVKANRRILKVRTIEGLHAVTALWQAYLSTIPGYMTAARILNGYDAPNEGIFVRFWQKVEFLATEFFRLTPGCPEEEGVVDDLRSHVLHALIRCNVAINLFRVALKKNPDYAIAKDASGNLPLHLLVETRPYRLKEREAIQACLEAAREGASAENFAGDLPLVIAIRNKIPWEKGMDLILEAFPTAVQRKDRTTGLYPFQLAAMVGGRVAVDTTFHLLCIQPDLVFSS